MSLLDVYGMSIGDEGNLCDSTSLVVFALDATGETTGDGIASVFVPLENDTITEVYGYVSSSVGSPPTYRIKIETLDGSDNPSNTPATASCWKDVTATGAGGQWLGGAVVANHSVGAAPAPLAITVRYQSGTCDASNYSNFLRYVSKVNNSHHPYHHTMTAGTWGSRTGIGLSALVVKYASGKIQPMCFHGTGTAFLVNNNTWNTGAGTPLYRGNALTPPLAMEISGVQIVARLPVTWDFRVNIYDGSTLIRQTATFDPGKLYSGTSSSFCARIPFEPFTHPANAKYYYVLEPTTTGNPTTVIHQIFDSLAALQAVGGLLVGATGTSGFTWTTYDNGTDGYRLYSIVPVVSRIEGGGAFIRRLVNR